MDHDVLLMVVVGAGLWTLGALARGLPRGKSALASSPAGVGVGPRTESRGGSCDDG
jgi:hypothetical protein